MKIQTRKFGEVDIDQGAIMTMPEGLSGFPGCERFVLIKDPQSDPFLWFQSLEEPDLSLVVINPFLFKADYCIDLKTIVESKGWQSVEEKDLMIYVVVNMSGEEKSRKITANLMGPLVINPMKNEVVQVIISKPQYSHQYNILKPS